MTDRMLTRRGLLLAGLGATLAACSRATPSTDVAAAPSPRPTPTASPSATPAPSPSPSPTATFDISSTPGGGAGLPTGIVPTSIRIPAIGVDATCVEVSIRADEVEVPDFGLAGWWVQTRKPGEIGPSVIGAHVDTKDGPDVFYRLRELRTGDEVTVADETGATRTFVVNADPIQVDKYERPPEVFGFGEARPELRLITCGGEFNPAIGHYTDNIVVFCHDPSYEA